MCVLCLCKPREYGDVFPGWTLMLATKSAPTENWYEGEYALVHGGIPVIAWNNDPVPDAFAGMTDAEIDAAHLNSRISNRVYDRASEMFRKHLRVVNGLGPIHALVTMAIANGYNVEADGCFESWLFHHMGILATSREPTPLHGSNS